MSDDDTLRGYVKHLFGDQPHRPTVDDEQPTPSTDDMTTFTRALFERAHQD